jgi:hypothetical protein
MGYHKYNSEMQKPLKQQQGIQVGIRIPPHTSYTWLSFFCWID